MSLLLSAESITALAGDDEADTFRLADLDDVTILIRLVENSAKVKSLFAQAGIDSQRVASEAAKSVRISSDTARREAARLAITHAVTASRQHQAAAVDVEHLLFGMLNCPSSTMNTVFGDLGLSPRSLEKALKRQFKISAFLDRRNNASSVAPFAKQPTGKSGRDRFGQQILPRGIAGRIAVGFFSLPTLAIGLAGCVGLIVALLDPVERKAGGHLNIVFLEVSLLIAVTSLGGLVWAVAAPAWLERFLEACTRRTGLLLLLLPVITLLLLYVQAVFK